MKFQDPRHTAQHTQTTTMDAPLTSTTRPNTMAILTVRVVKSLAYRSIKNHVFQSIDLTTTTAPQLLEMIKEVVKTNGGFRAQRTVDLNALKIYTKAHGSKTMNLAINLDNPEWMLDMNDDKKTLLEYGIENETELSCFNLADYEEFAKNPEQKW